MRSVPMLVAVVIFAVAERATAAPDPPGFDLSRMKWADQQIEKAIEAGKIPGAVLLVGRGDDIVYRKAYGNRVVEPQTAKMAADTIFDMASVSKVVGCATSIMLLVERGQVNLTDRVAEYIPEFGVNGKEDVTIEQLLLHRGGLVPDNPLSDYEGTPAESLARVYALAPVYEPGARYKYSDVGYIVLGELVRIVDGRPLDQFAREEIFEPLGMTDTSYSPPASWRQRCAPTEKRGGEWIVGEVHDPRAYALGGVAGHAGLFGTADDLSRWCRMILKGGTLDGKRVLSEMTVREMTRSRSLPDGTGCRGYGVGIGSHTWSARGNLFEEGTTFGHTGWTGTLFWIDPWHDCYVILLTNRVHPDGKGSAIDLRQRVLTVVASAIIESPDERYLPSPTDWPRPPSTHRHPTGPPANVLCGIDLLKRDRYRLLEGKRIALITNHTGRDREGNRTIDLLVAAKSVNVVKLFSPEHGLYGIKDEHVADSVDEVTKIEVFSLYGKTRRPTPEMLEGVDCIVFDIQDIGTRFYTYIATMGIAMEEAARHGIEVVVLDRPNPITGVVVDGPIYDGKERRFTAFGPLPVVHGMTVGELARMFNAEYGINCRLTVVEIEGWKRSMYWDQTGLTWVNPSPNMRNLTQAILYPAVGLIEATNVSVGRGTDQPFEIFGAPWIDGRKLAAALNGARLPGLRFVPVEFTPRSSKHAGRLCRGVYIIVTDRRAVQPVRSGMTIAWHLNKLFGKTFDLDKVLNLLANRATLTALTQTDDPAKLPAGWAKNLAAFKKVREKYLIYP